MIIQKSKTTKIPVNAHHVVWDYPMVNSSVGFSYQEIQGETPEHSWWKNTVCDEWYYVLSGTGTIYVEDACEQCHEGDIVILPVGKKHKIVGNHLRMIAITKPDWCEEQAQIIND